MSNQSYTAYALLAPNKEFGQWTLYDREKKQTIARFPEDERALAQCAFDALKLGVPAEAIKIAVDRSDCWRKTEDFLLSAIKTYRAAIAKAKGVAA